MLNKALLKNNIYIDSFSLQSWNMNENNNNKYLKTNHFKSITDKTYLVNKILDLFQGKRM